MAPFTPGSIPIILVVIFLRPLISVKLLFEAEFVGHPAFGHLDGYQSPVTVGTLSLSLIERESVQQRGQAGGSNMSDRGKSNEIQ
jgi:hypothetical protein